MITDERVDARERDLQNRAVQRVRIFLLNRAIAASPYACENRGRSGLGDPHHE